MFEQHPVPQQISSYQFRLVGDMTLKQFFQLAAGAVLGLIIYATPLPSIFKWPLIIFFVVVGAAFAFLPLQDRPLSEWLAAFFRAVYGPTKYVWEKGSTKSYFSPATGTTSQPSITTKLQDSSVAKLEASESKFLSGLGGIAVNPPTAPQANVISANVVPEVKPEPIQRPTPAPTPVTVPQVPQITVPRQNVVSQAAPAQTTNTIATNQMKPVMEEHDMTGNIQAAATSPDAAPPTPTTIPNIIVGQVLTTDKRIIEGAIMEVKDFQGRPVRALKSNKLGHFMIVTPLPPGSYTITTEKEGYSFEPVSIQVHGTIIPPILIKPKEVTTTNLNN